MKFGFVTEDQADIVQKYKVKKFPTVVIQQGAKGEKKAKGVKKISYF